MKNYKGEERKIGVELEFHGLSPLKAAQVVAQQTGGDIEEKNRDMVSVQSPDGEYRLETDASFLKKLSKKSQENKDKKIFDWEGSVRDFLSTFSDELVPTELVTPPIDTSKLFKVTALHKALSDAGAQGTFESARFAFGAQLNPEITSEEVDVILNQFRAFILLSAWLKNQIQMDTTRKLTSFAGEFPKDYLNLILKEDYAPTLEGFMEDYLKHSPTRNRSLDMLPLFAFFDEEKVRVKAKGQKINARPTFHYRLPNSQMSLESWNIEIEWKRWLLVEKLAEDKELRLKMSKRFLRVQNEGLSTWLVDSNNYVERLRS